MSREPIYMRCEPVDRFSAGKYRRVVVEALLSVTSHPASNNGSPPSSVMSNDTIMPTGPVESAAMGDTVGSSLGTVVKLIISDLRVAVVVWPSIYHEYEVPGFSSCSR